MMTPKDILSKGWTRDGTRHYSNSLGYVIYYHDPSKRWVMTRDGKDLFNFYSLTSAVDWYEVNIR